MARRKKKPRRKPPDAGPQASGATAAATPAHPSDAVPVGNTAPPSRAPFVVALSAVLAWIAALAVLAVTTANPPMLNRAQIEQADLIITGTVVDVERGVVDVQTIWKPARAAKPLEGEGPLTVGDLSGSKARDGATYLLPLTRAGDDAYRITRPQLPRDPNDAAKRPARIYPATAEAVEQLRDVLNQRP